MIDKKEVKAIVKKAIDDIRDLQYECGQQIAIMNKHKFRMESEALSYSFESYHASWCIISDALDKIEKLKDL